MQYDWMSVYAYTSPTNINGPIAVALQSYSCKLTTGLFIYTIMYTTLYSYHPIVPQLEREHGLVLYNLMVSVKHLSL